MTADNIRQFFMTGGNPAQIAILEQWGFRQVDKGHGQADLIIGEAVSGSEIIQDAPTPVHLPNGTVANLSLLDDLIARFADRDSDAPVLDLAHLDRYTAGDRSLQRDVLALFTPTAMGYWQEMAAADTAKNWHNGAHSLKGTARGLGAVMLETLATEAESLKDSPETWQRQCMKLRRAILQVHLFILANLAADAENAADQRQ